MDKPLRIALCFFLFHALLPAQQIFPGILNVQAPHGGGAPTFNTGFAMNVSCTSTTCTTNSFSTTTGDYVAVVFGVQAGSSQLFCGTGNVSSVTSSTGDTYTFVGSQPSMFTFGTCLGGYHSFAVTGSASTVLTLHITNAITGIGVLVFHPGGISALDGSVCGNGSNSATAIACSSALSPSGSVGLIIGAVYGFDGGVSAPTANSPFIIPSGGNASAGGFGSITVSYYIANPVSGTYTPGFTSIQTSDGGSVLGWAVK